ncbi:MAG: NAD(P)/FAD-dependent oxidoreductase [Chloroflexota bacterium]|jgi:thioredoxin reductase (NADPH)
MVENGHYEVLIIGGGPAGLSAAVYMARYDRQVALFDTGRGRSNWHQVNHNYLGFPGGVKAREIRARGREQVESYDQVTILPHAITEMARDGSEFIARGEQGEWRGQSVILATGVTDRWPKFEDWQEYVGRSMFWCLTCDGYASRGKKLVTLGNDNPAACTTLQLQRFAPDITMLTGTPTHTISQVYLDRLANAGIPLVCDEIESVAGKDGQFEAIYTKDGWCIELECLFNLVEAVPNTKLARDLGVELNDIGYIKVDTEQRTNVEGVYAAGDVTWLHSHQIAAAVHEGGQAASAANYFLYPPELREP